jgi:hypothetical protein
VATRRKYKVPAYKDGGAVRVDNIIVAPPVEAPVQVEHCSTSGRPPVEAAPPPADDDPLVKAHRAQQRAEEIQRNAARAPQGNANRPPSIDDVVNAIPGLSEHKRQFLKANSNLLQPANVDAVRFHYHAALNAGVVDDTPEMNQAIPDGIARERARAVAQAKAIVEPPCAGSAEPAACPGLGAGFPRGASHERKPSTIGLEHSESGGARHGASELR